ncbi:MAG: inorganic phosphate transporter [Candidatus Omnitrophica bacterium]|nr:inorganic phosphate transporter [Candidatus Omnitrophota bacterium]
MIWTIVILITTLFVAYANGANDNFKGVATLFGSGTADYRKALLWATAATFAGSIAAFFLAAKLIQTFSGKGLVPDVFLANPAFLVSVILGAGLSVFIAARIGIPISTTHALTGALAGSGWLAAGDRLGFTTLGHNFFIPLLFSPIIAIVLTAALYPLFRLAGERAGIRKNTCVCIGERIIPVGNLSLNENGMLSVAELKSLDILVDEKEACEAKAVELYSGRVLGIEVGKILDFGHFLSAGAVSFSRGLNDTPKIVALSLGAGALGLGWNIGGVALAMAAGGLASARRVAETMSKRITRMNHSEGFTANLVTAFLVIAASGWGMPVSTTHVSCGSLFGLGLVTGKARWKVIGGIVSAWVLTLPAAALLAGISYGVLR